MYDTEFLTFSIHFDEYNFFLFDNGNKQSCELCRKRLQHVGLILQVKTLSLLWNARSERGDIGPSLFDSEAVMGESFRRGFQYACCSYTGE